MAEGAVFVRPNDVVIFRQSTQFDAGEGISAAGVFPPTGIPFIGAFRARIIADSQFRFSDFADPGRSDEALAALREEIGDIDSFGQLQLRGPWPAFRRAGRLECFFPSPMDHGYESKQLSKDLLLSQPLDSSGNEVELLPRIPKRLEPPFEEGWIPSQAFANYLRGQAFSPPRDEFWGTEESVGIARGPARSVTSGMLYKSEFVRFDDWSGGNPGMGRGGQSGFLLWFSHRDRIGSGGTVALGGEGRSAEYENVEPGNLLKSIFIDQLAGRQLVGKKLFKLYLSTPSVFRNGWYPDFLVPKDGKLVGEIGGKMFSLRAATVGKASTISGWNIRLRKPRPLLKTVPAGSVYHFEFEDAMDQELIRRLFESLHFKSICGLGPKFERDDNPELARYAGAGLGTAFVGAVGD